MNEYIRKYRIVPLWAAMVMTLPIGGGTLSMFRWWSYDSTAAFPMFLMFWYLLVMAYVNRCQVRVTWEGARVAFGPIPLIPPLPMVSHADIAKVYVRHAVRPGRYASYPYLAAGVERKDGTWVDLSEPQMEDAKVWDEARAIAKALSWPHSVEELWGRARKEDWLSVRPLLYWGGAFAASFGWAIFVEAFLRH